MTRLLGIALATTLAGCATVQDTVSGLKFWGDPAPTVDPSDPRLAEFGQFVGTWSCNSERKTESGWVKGSGTHTWRWKAILDGRAIQDFWFGAPQGDMPPVRGTNIRIFNAERERWEIAWTSSQQQEWDLIWAESKSDGSIVMHMRRPTREAYQAHVARITFSDITPERFVWAYEASPLGGERNYETVSKMTCRRAD